MIPEQCEAITQYVVNNGYRIVREPAAESMSTAPILPVENCCDPEGSYCYYWRGAVLGPPGLVY